MYYYFTCIFIMKMRILFFGYWCDHWKYTINKIFTNVFKKNKLIYVEKKERFDDNVILFDCIIPISSNDIYILYQHNIPANKIIGSNPMIINLCNNKNLFYNFMVKNYLEHYIPQPTDQIEDYKYETHFYLETGMCFYSKSYKYIFEKNGKTKNKYTIENMEINDDVKKQLLIFFEIIKYTGFCHIHYTITNDDIIIFKCNPGFSNAIINDEQELINIIETALKLRNMM